MEEMPTPSADGCNWHAVVDSDGRLLFAQTRTDPRIESIVALMFDDFGLAPWLDRAIGVVSEFWKRDDAANRDLRLRLSTNHDLRIFPLLGQNTRWIGIVLNEREAPVIARA